MNVGTPVSCQIGPGSQGKRWWLLICFALDEYISAILQSGKWYDSDWHFVCMLYRRHRALAFFDVGANMGTLTLPVSMCLKNFAKRGKTVAVEAHPGHARLLKASLSANNLAQNVLLFQYAVDNSTGGTLTIDTYKGNQGASTAVKPLPWPETQWGEFGDSVTAPVTTIDAIYSTAQSILRSVLFMKIDIEGYEGRALYGASKFLSEAPPCYLKMEVQTRWLKLAGTPILELLGYIGSKGYEPMHENVLVWHLDAFGGGSREAYFVQKNLSSCLMAKYRSVAVFHANKRSR